MSQSSPNLLRGTLELFILRALSYEPLHGYGVLEWIERVTEGGLVLEEGTLYPALHRMERRGLVESSWGASENNRRAKFYRLTEDGVAQLGREADEWRSFARAVEQALSAAPASPEAIG